MGNVIKKLSFSLQALASFLLTGGGVFYLLLYTGVALARITYPYELEWIEGGAVDHVRWILAGHPLYVAPSLQFVPMIYTPLYFYFSAFISLFFGANFFSLRLVSFLASLGCFALILLFVQRETRSWLSGIFGAGLFAATFRIAGAWFDIARTDSLSLFLLLAGVYVIRSERVRFPKSTGPLPAWATDAAAALLLALSFLTKQNALGVAVALCIYCLIARERWQKLVFPLVFLLLLGISTLVFNWASSGWYGWYIFTLPNQHVIHWDMLPRMLVDDFAAPFWGGVFTATVFFAVSIFRLVKSKTAPGWKNLVFHLAFLGGMVAASVVARIHSGGYSNTLIPAYAAIAIYGSLGAHTILSRPSALRNRITPAQTRSRLVSLVLSILLVLGFAWQFRMLYYSPRDQVPPRSDIKAGNAFIAQLKDIQGEVFIPYHGYLPSLAGKQTYAQGGPMEDVFRSTDKPIRDALHQDIHQAILDRRFAAIILDDDWRFNAEITKNYEYAGTIFEGSAFKPVTGMPTRPQFLYLLRK